MVSWVAPDLGHKLSEHLYMVRSLSLWQPMQPESALWGRDECEQTPVGLGLGGRLDPSEGLSIHHSQHSSWTSGPR